MPGTDLAYGAISAYALAMRCPVLSSRATMFGTELSTMFGTELPTMFSTELAGTAYLRGYPSISLWPCTAYAYHHSSPGTNLGLWCYQACAGGQRLVGCGLREPGTLLRTYYAMSGTNLAYDAIRLCAWYAMSGTSLACGAIRLWAWYAMSGTDLS
eukprot:3671812-Rhodomonas_salina.2